MRPSRGILDAQTGASQAAAIAQINSELRTIASEQAGIYVLDYDGLVARHGRATWHDERKWLTVRLPIAATNLYRLVREWLRFLHPLTGKVAKALVVDLDNTLWGGVIGEDGMAGIRLGTEYPEPLFRPCNARSWIYTGGESCSPSAARTIPRTLSRPSKSIPGMILKPSHFAAIRINWTDKSQNLREIAQELNIGVDALAFLDDNPIERQQVRSALPEVFVIDLAADPMEFAHAIRDCPLFERLALSAEDQQRGAMYQAQRDREQLEQTVTSREDFYRSLQQEAEIAPLTKATLARVAQLTNKTNQFNLTTRRYTEQQIADLVASPGWRMFFAACT